MKIRKFEDLDIWKMGLKITKDIYDLTYEKKFSRDFCLRDQIRRATISITSNIVEGFEKNSNNEFRRFLKMSKGSLGEVRNQLYIATILGYLDQKEFNKVNEFLLLLAGKIGALIRYLGKTRNP